MLIEINVDGIVGPTHHFGGLGVGNVASIEHERSVSHPKRAALEALRKAELVASLGVPQFLLPPPTRPRLSLLGDLGFHGTIQQQLDASLQQSPQALSAAFSSAFMWVANAATVTPTTDSVDRRFHCTPANLVSSWHRGSEASERGSQLLSLMAGLDEQVVVHSPLPSIVPLRDEGEANHMRLCDSSGCHGFNIFVYGENESLRETAHSQTFFARHTLGAALAIARKHRLSNDRTFFLQQHPRAIDAGVFHNDVIATSCDHLLVHHQYAFVDASAELKRLEEGFQSVCREPMLRIEVSDQELPLADAVRSYFFNSQIIRVSSRERTARYTLLSPHHCKQVASASQLIERLLSDPRVPIDSVHFVGLEESMAGGGGPACLRLRMLHSEEAIMKLDQRFRVTSRLVDCLSKLIEDRYPEQLTLDNLCDAGFIDYLKHIDESFHRLFWD